MMPDGPVALSDLRFLLRPAALAVRAVARGEPVRSAEGGEPLWEEARGHFVTLRGPRELRGCVGTLTPHQPLRVALPETAGAAATSDSRFPPVATAELGGLHVELSLLSPLERIASPDEFELGRHGVAIRHGFRSGVYLPQVIHETGWGREEFLRSLCEHKAGLAGDAWRWPGAELYRFEVDEVGDSMTSLLGGF